MADEENSEIAQRIAERLLEQMAEPGSQSWARWKFGPALGNTQALVLTFRGGVVACLHSYKGRDRGYEYEFAVMPARDPDVAWAAVSSADPESAPARIWTVASQRSEKQRLAAAESFAAELDAFFPSAEERALEDVVLQVGMSLLRRTGNPSAAATEWHRMRGASGYLTELTDGLVVIEHNKSGYRLQLTDVDSGRALAESVSDDPQSVPGRVFTAAHQGHLERATAIAGRLKAELDEIASR